VRVQNGGRPPGREILVFLLLSIFLETLFFV
jgi:hypothetical protein